MRYSATNLDDIATHFDEMGKTSQATPVLPNEVWQQAAAIIRATDLAATPLPRRRRSASTKPAKPPKARRAPAAKSAPAQTTAPAQAGANV